MKQLKGILIVLSAFVIVTSQSRESARPRVKITVYFENNCAACDSFLFQQLFPTYADIGEYMSVYLVPYGSTTQITLPDGSISFKCSKNEHCVDMKIQACVLQKFGSWHSGHHDRCFLICALREPRSAGKCAKLFNYNDDGLAACVNSVEGDLLLADHANRTSEVSSLITSSTLPLITIDGVYNETEQAMARSNLLRLVCDRLKTAAGHENSQPMTSHSNNSRHSYPKVCNGARAKHTMTHNNFDTGFVYNPRSSCIV